MTYMQDLEQQLHNRLESFAAGDLSAKDFIAFVKKTVLDSYHNGQNAGPRQTAQSNGRAAPSTSQTAHSNGQAAQSGRPQWHTKNRSAGNAPANRGNYRS